MRPETLFLDTSEHFVLRNLRLTSSGTLTTIRRIVKSHQSLVNPPLAGWRTGSRNSGFSKNQVLLPEPNEHFMGPET